MATSISSGKKIVSLVAIAAAAFTAGYLVHQPEQYAQPMQGGRYATSMKVADCVAAKTLDHVEKNKTITGGAWEIEQLGQCANNQLGGIFEKDPTYPDSTRYEDADAAMWSVLSEFMDKAVYTQRLRQHDPEIEYARASDWLTSMDRKEDLKHYKEVVLPNGPLDSRPVDRVANAYVLADCTLNFISTADEGRPSDLPIYRASSVHVCLTKGIGGPATIEEDVSDHDGRIESKELSYFVDMDVYNQQFNARYKEMLKWGIKKTEYPQVVNP